MNKSDLIDALVAKVNVTKNDAARTIEALVETIVEAVKKGDIVSLIGFGTFKSAARKAREGKNPKTGEKIKIPATKVPRFTAGAGFKSAVSGKAPAKKAAAAKKAPAKKAAAPAKKAAAKPAAKKAAAKKK